MEDGSALLCPRCNVPLKDVRTSQGIFWACENCGGRALTVELLRRTFTPESINPLWLHAISGEGKSGRLCPSCRKPMLEVALSENAQVDVDVCQHCHFVWFDAHDMDTLAPRQLPASTPDLPPEARELIAIEKVRQIAEEARGTDFDSAPPDEGWKQIAGFFGVPVEFEAPEEERNPWAT
jgi:Zn-finger nucleic acid-binding protein